MHLPKPPIRKNKPFILNINPTEEKKEKQHPKTKININPSLKFKLNTHKSAEPISQTKSQSYQSTNIQHKSQKIFVLDIDNNLIRYHIPDKYTTNAKASDDGDMLM